MPDHDSILAKIDGRGKKAPRVELRELPDDPGEKPKETARHQTGRYRVLGEIGRGGVGVVLMGRDVDLGRVVAMKVLRADHQENAELISRFVEEAQIGGQLQHPGIVPVYELGLAADERPYFVMKLVKGRTMDALLHERKGPADRRRRFLSIFAQVCQTIAYAHSRGVIHRDLKPGNVMVGAFGEVQVVDWGFAKVLPRGGIAAERPPKVAQADGEAETTRISTVRTTGKGSESIPGSVMGTPAYMPPEQALGEVDELDERTDVFALGAMLTEVLTGEPVYIGESLGDLLVLAARCQTDDALARLDACGADPRLVALAKSCLSTLREDRPDDAAALARVVTHHLAAAEERAQQSKLAAIEARRKAAEAQAKAADLEAKSQAARAAAEQEKAKADRARHQAERAAAEADRAHKTRKQMVMLAGAVVVVVLVVGGAFWFVGKGRRARERETEAQVNRALESARFSQGDGQWDEAVLAARQAILLGGGEDAQSVLDAIEKAKARAAAASDRRRGELAFVARLEEIRLQHADDKDRNRAHASYRLAFSDYGIDIEKLTAGKAKKKIRAIPEWPEVVAVLDEWAWLQDVHSAGSEALMAKLTRIVKATDPDRLRNRLRDALAKPDTEDPRALAAQAELADKQVLRSIPLMAVALARSGDRMGAIALLRKMQERHPADLWINRRLAIFLAQAKQHGEAARFYTAALALRPRSIAIRNRLCAALCSAGETRAALAISHDAVKLAPRDRIARAHLAAALVRDGERDGGLRAYAAALELSEDRAAVHLAFGQTLGELGDAELRLEALRKAVATSAEPNYFAHLSLGAALRDAGDPNGAVAELRKAIALSRDGYRAYQQLGQTLHELGLHADAVKALRTCIGLRPYDWQAYHNLALPLNALGKYDDALAAAQRAREFAPTRAEPHLGLALIRLRQGKLRHAAKAFFRARPLGGVAYRGLGVTFAAMGDLEQAEIAAREAVRLDPKDALAVASLGHVLAAQGDFEGAVGKFRAALKLGRATSAQLNLARILAKNDPAAAINMLETARKETPGAAPGALRAMGLVRLENDDLNGAIEILNEALTGETRLGTTHKALTWLHLGHAHMRKGKLKQALAAFNKSQDLGTSGPYWTEPTYLLIGECEELLAAEDTITLAKRRYYERKWNKSLALFGKAFKEGSAGERLIAARAAARVGQRAKALGWLHEGLARLAPRLDDADMDERRETRRALLELTDLPDFRPYRVERLLRNIPEPERGEWRAFWVELRLALSKPRPLN